ncbi:hypothetical protein AB0H51_28165 [Streptomyces griseoluteus]|uniref:hypothetical protein n=1 Tax=Streptomyces griseoluteus TaxID=29306 RepID=UPI0033F7054C
MSDLYAACTPNSLPVDGSTPHGYQLTVLDGGMRVSEVADLPDWETFDGDEADRRLTSMGYVPTGSWSEAGLGHMTAVTRIDEPPV